MFSKIWKYIFSDTKLVLNIALTILCTIFFICSLFLHFGNLEKIVTLSGPLGDTVGGLFSPIIGVITLFLVYRTFHDQRSSNFHSKSATNLSLLLNELERIKGKMLSREQNNDLIYIVKHINIIDSWHLFDRDNELYKSYLSSSIELLKETCSLIENNLALNLHPTHRSLLNKYVKIWMIDYSSIYNEVFIEIQYSLCSLSNIVNDMTDEELKDKSIVHSNIRFYDRAVKEYRRYIEILTRYDIVKQESNESTPGEVFFDNSPLSKGIIKEIAIQNFPPISMRII